MEFSERFHHPAHKLGQCLEAVLLMRRTRKIPLDINCTHTLAIIDSELSLLINLLMLLSDKNLKHETISIEHFRVA